MKRIILLCGLLTFLQGGLAHSGDSKTPAVTVASKPEFAIDGRQLLVNGEPFIIKGVAWSPVPRGGTLPDGIAFEAYADIDIPMMQELGFNTVRTYLPIRSKEVLDKLHAADIMVINAVYNLGWQELSVIDDVVSRLKGHPAILMWSVGNEWNYNGLYHDLDFETSAKRVNEAARRIKSIDPHTPVATIYGELPDSNLVEQLDQIDIWATNVYRNDTFGDIFEKWEKISDKPMFIAEYGADAYNANTDDKGEPIGLDPASQNWATIALTKEIFDHIVKENSQGKQTGVVIGGTIFSWADEWWKSGNPEVQDTGGIAPGGGPYPDLTFNEEYWGIVDIDRKPRCAYYSLKALYSSFTDGTPFKEIPCDATD